MDRLEAAFVGFSFLAMMKRIFSTKSDNDYFHTLDSIRVLSFAYSVLGLTYTLGTIYSEAFTTGEFTLTASLTQPLNQALTQPLTRPRTQPPNQSLN